MSYQYEFHPIAQEEYIGSISWYFARSGPAASNFVKAVEKGFIKICNDPKRHRNVYKNYFEFNLQKYPFTMFILLKKACNPSS